MLKKIINVISYTKKGEDLNCRLCGLLSREGYALRSYRHFEKSCREYKKSPDDPGQNMEVVEKDFGVESIKQRIALAFEHREPLVFIAAAGIAVRSIAPYVKDKFLDPSVLVMDESGRYVISLLSGHVGGANALTKTIATLIGGEAVITTATDVNKIWAVDEWARKNHLALSDRELAKKVSAKLLAGEELELVSGYLIRGEVPKYLRNAKSDLAIYITNRNFKKSTRDRAILRLIPKNLCLGVGCRKGITESHMMQAFDYFIGKYFLEEAAFACIATIDIKSKEPAVLALAKRLDVEIKTFGAEELENVEGEFTESEFVKETVGVGNVCERAARCVYNEPMIPKESLKGVTFAVTYDKREFVFEV